MTTELSQAQFGFDLVDLNNGGLLFTSTDSNSLTYEQLLTASNERPGTIITVMESDTTPQDATLTINPSQDARNQAYSQTINGITKYVTAFSAQASHMLLGETPLNQTVTFSNL